MTFAPLSFYNKNEYRCKFCHRLLGRGEIVNGLIEIKCHKCGKISEFIEYPLTDAETTAKQESK